MKIDSIIFDVDGVLWDAQDAYMRCTLHVVQQVCRDLALSDPNLTLDDLWAFKRAGRFNSDWDLSWTLVTLCQARSSGLIPDHVSWPDLADKSGGRGIAWTRQYAGDDVLDYAKLQLYYDAHYWGADRYAAIYDRPPVVDFRPGFADAERSFVAPDLMARLRGAGVERIGIITGRNRNEMRTPLAALDFDGLLDPNVIFTAERGDKPEPTLLKDALERLGSRRAVMVGDTIDDLRTVLHYRQLPAAQQTATVSGIVIAPPADTEYWLQREADLVLSTVNQLPEAIGMLNGELPIADGE